MKILLRIIGYFGTFLLIITTETIYGYVSALATLGAILVIIAIVEALIKYGKWE